MIARNHFKDGYTVCFLVFTVVGLILVIPYIQNGDKKIRALQDAKLLAMAKRDSASPSADLILRLEKYRRSKVGSTDGGAERHYYNDGAYYTYAAACGATGGFLTDGGGGGDGMKALSLTYLLCSGYGGRGCGGGGCGG